MEQKTKAEIEEFAWEVFRGDVTLHLEEDAVQIRGAWNDYNARGRGSTSARRVLRDGKWEWVSAPAARGRFRAGDRHDTKHGDVYVGELVAEFTLGGNRKPDAFYLVTGKLPDCTAKMVNIASTKTKSGYKISRGQSHIIVSDPYWR